jgi:hypothetical protein
MKHSARIIMMIAGTILFFLTVFPYPQKLYANPPQDVNISYDSGSQILTVTITHKSAARSFHYIKHVEIKKNGAVISDNTYGTQPDSETFTYTYKLPAVENDKLEVTASCSLWGHKTATLVLSKTKQSKNI